MALLLSDVFFGACLSAGLSCGKPAPTCLSAGLSEPTCLSADLLLSGVFFGAGLSAGLPCGLPLSTVFFPPAGALDGSFDSSFGRGVGMERLAG